MNDAYLKAIKKDDRELELELNGGMLRPTTRVHKNKKKYDRKQNKYTSNIVW